LSQLPLESHQPRARAIRLAAALVWAQPLPVQSLQHPVLLS
jgi:hypothetical protein